MKWTRIWGTRTWSTLFLDPILKIWWISSAIKDIEFQKQSRSLTVPYIRGLLQRVPNLTAHRWTDIFTDRHQKWPTNGYFHCVPYIWDLLQRIPNLTKLRWNDIFTNRDKKWLTQGYSHLSGMEMTSRLNKCFQSVLRPVLRAAGGAGWSGSPVSQW